MPDSGTISIVLGDPNNPSLTGSVTYGGEDDSQLASELASAMTTYDTNNDGPMVTATTYGASLTMTAIATGAASNYPMTISIVDTSNPGGDDYPYNSTGNGTQFTGGLDATTPGPIYSYALTYQPNSNVATVNDQIMGSWTYGYDPLNRLLSAQAGPNNINGAAPYQLAQLSWTYDAFGNNQGQTLSGTTSATVTQGSYSFNANNQIIGDNYDPAGNQIGTGGGPTFNYDAENRIVPMTAGYIYDAEGRRTPKELPALIERLSEPSRTLVITASVTGLRRGELFGLKWQDVEFDSRRINIVRSLVNHIVGVPKTATSRRPIPLTPALASVLETWKTQTAYSKPGDWVFASPASLGLQPYWPDVLLRRHIRPAANAAGINKTIGWHTFRRTTATLLLSTGANIRVAQELLRHASPVITQGTYSRALPEDKVAAQAALASLLGIVGMAGQTASQPVAA